MGQATTHARAYSGTAPYIFVSYAHRDSDTVIPILEYLICHGYNVWYDEGITPGADWDEFLNQKILGCSCFLCFLSEHSVASPECLKEMRRAEQAPCEVLSVFLEPVEPPADLKSSFMSRQVIEHWRMADQTEFYIKLLSHSLFDPCQETEEFLINDGALLRYNGSAKDIIVPDAVTQIGYDAFEGDQNAVSVRIPAAVDRIGKFAFNNMPALQIIDVDEGNGFFASVGGVLYNKALNYLLRYPSARCENEYEVKEGVKNVAIVAFAGAASLRTVTVPESVTMIGDRAFESCRNLVSVDLTAAIDRLHPYTFSRCANLVSIELPSRLRSIGDGAFSGCSSLPSIDIPDTVESVGEMAFAYCESITSLTLPPHVREAAEYCFHECKDLRTVGLGQAVRVRQYAFKNCESLESVSFSPALESIDRAAFSGCQSLRSVILPDSVAVLGEYSFDRCTSLEEVTCGAGLKRIESGAFVGDDGLRVVRVPASIEHIAPDAFDKDVTIERY